MRLVPEDNAGRIAFYTSHLAQWADHAAELGTTPEDVAELQALLDEATAARTAQAQAQAAAQSATLRLNTAIEALMSKGSTIVSQIRVHAAVDGGAVYSLARIPPPAEPSPVAAPGKPDRFHAAIGGVGELTLTWACKNPRAAVGTMYKVSRQIAVGGPFEFVGLVGEKRFVDETIPPGTATVTYQLQAFRSTKAGPVATYSVHFGTIGIRSALQLAA